MMIILSIIIENFFLIEKIDKNTFKPIEETILFKLNLLLHYRDLL